MIRLFVLGVVLATSACSSTSRIFGGSSPKADPDSLYHRALHHLDPANRFGSLDSAVALLDNYLFATDANLRYRVEASAMRRLARDSQQLTRVQAALNQARTSQPAQTTAEARPRETAEAPRQARDEEAVKEIQRLKDELAKANAELERIRKRLATPKP